MFRYNFLSALWMFVLPLLAILLPVWLGERYGKYMRKKMGQHPDAPISSAVAGALGLFAFMLAFTFQIAGDRYDKRKELFIGEVADIRTSFLYAGLVPEPIRSDARRLIVSYVDARVELLHGHSELEQVKSRSQKILDTLWNYSEMLAVQDRSSEAYSLFTTSISQLLRMYNERIAIALQMRLPPTILFVLAFVGFFSMAALGYYFGIAGEMNFAVNLVLAIAFAAVMWLVFALDKPEAGLIGIDQSALMSLQEQLHQKQK